MAKISGLVMDLPLPKAYSPDCLAMTFRNWAMDQRQVRLLDSKPNDLTRRANVNAILSEEVLPCPEPDPMDLFINAIVLQNPTKGRCFGCNSPDHQILVDCPVIKQLSASPLQAKRVISALEESLSPDSKTRGRHIRSILTTGAPYSEPQETEAESPKE